MAPHAVDSERRLLAVMLGRRLEAMERGLDETEAALRRLARCVPPEGLVWLTWAGLRLARVREALDDLMGRAVRAEPPRPSSQHPPENEPE